MKQIKLSNSVESIIIDDEDHEKVSKFKWYLIRSPRGHIISRTQPDNLTIGRFILGLYNIDLKLYNSALEADHKDRNIFNNQKSNLREATHSQNMANQPKQRNNTSGYKGVSWHKRDKVWTASIMILGKTKNLGSFKTKEEAALKYNKAALSYFGEFAYLNVVPEVV